MADRIRVLLPQEIKKSRDQDTRKAGSSDQASISTVEVLDRRCSWKYRAHSSDYPLTVMSLPDSYFNLELLYKSMAQTLTIFDTLDRYLRGRKSVFTCKILRDLGIVKATHATQNTKAALQSASKKLLEIKDKVEILQDTAEIKDCEDTIKFIEEELRRLEVECYRIYLQLIIWLIFFLSWKNALCTVIHLYLLSSQTLEIILVASGDVERNPGPTYLTGMLIYC